MLGFLPDDALRWRYCKCPQFLLVRGVFCLSCCFQNVKCMLIWIQVRWQTRPFQSILLLWLKDSNFGQWVTKASSTISGQADLTEPRDGPLLEFPVKTVHTESYAFIHNPQRSRCNAEATHLAHFLLSYVTLRTLSVISINATADCTEVTLRFRTNQGNSIRM